MMKRYFEKIEFDRLNNDPGFRVVLEDLEFLSCGFTSSHLSAFGAVEGRPELRRIRASRCRINGCTINGSVLEDVIWENCINTGLLRLYGCVFRRVSIRGKTGRILINGYHSLSDPDAARVFNMANEVFYNDVDWALDIRQFAGLELQIEAVPTQLIRRNPETQVVIRRDRLMDKRWQSLPLEAKVSQLILRDLMDSNEESRLLVVPPSADYADKQLRDVQVLRRAGLVE